MKFGIRECANIVFRAKSDRKIGGQVFKKHQPVLYIDTATTSTLEQAVSTVYAVGGRGAVRLLSWDGEKQITFTFEDALISPIGISILASAGLLKGGDTQKVNVHVTTETSINSNGEIDLSDAINSNEELCDKAPLFILEVEADGSVTGNVYRATTVNTTTNVIVVENGTSLIGKQVKVDYYVARKSSQVYEVQIRPEMLGGNFYIEADTLFRRQDNGDDMPAILTIPNAKVQSNITFTMAGSGDPSTFTFTVDAFPGYTYFNARKKTIVDIQIIDDSASDDEWESVFQHSGYGAGATSATSNENLDELEYPTSTTNRPVNGDDADTAANFTSVVKSYIGTTDSYANGGTVASAYTITWTAGTGVTSVTPNSSTVSYGGTVTAPEVTPATGYKDPYIYKIGDETINLATYVVKENAAITVSGTPE